MPKCPHCPAEYSTQEEVNRHYEAKWEHLRERLAVADGAILEASGLLSDARSLIDTLNGNIQGQDRAEVRDPVAYAACQDMITRIDAAIG